MRRRADDYRIEMLPFKRGVQRSEPGDPVLRGDFLQQRRVGIAGEELRPARLLETTNVPLADAADADDQNIGLHGRESRQEGRMKQQNLPVLALSRTNSI